MKGAAAALLAAAALCAPAFFMPPPLFDGTDFVRLHRINRRYAAARVAEGHLPLWNPYVGLGRPFLADIETAFFYPPNVVEGRGAQLSPDIYVRAMEGGEGFVVAVGLLEGASAILCFATHRVDGMERGGGPGSCNRVGAGGSRSC